MPEPIEFRIMQSLQTALKSINTVNGYHHTVNGFAVKLDPDHKVEDLIGGANDPIGPPRPFIVLAPLPMEFNYEPANQLLMRMPFMIHAFHDSDPTDDNAKLATYHRLCADVETALAADITRGGLATDTIILTQQMRDHDGQFVEAQIPGQVRYRRTYGAPNG